MIFPFFTMLLRFLNSTFQMLLTNIILTKNNGNYKFLMFIRKHVPNLILTSQAQSFYNDLCPFSLWVSRIFDNYLMYFCFIIPFSHPTIIFPNLYSFILKSFPGALVYIKCVSLYRDLIIPPFLRFVYSLIGNLTKM